MLPKSITIYKALYEYMGTLEFTINRRYSFRAYPNGSRVVTLFGEGEVTAYYSLIMCNSVEEKLYTFLQVLCATGYNHIINDISNRTTNAVK